MSPLVPIRSPFKFLDYFSKEDRESFFGRDKEIERLYELVKHHRLVLVYGPSGTGKTSLIRCGLANRFDATEWLEIYIKRGNNQPNSLLSALKGKLRRGKDQFTDTADLVKLVDTLANQYFRPVYLIFDQFEELFIEGSEEEREHFIQQLAIINGAGLSCRVILVIREEFIGRLYELEQTVPITYEQRMRVEPLTAPVIKEEVLKRSFILFNLQLDNSELTNQMLENLNGLKNVIPLPYLQVYLDCLWQEAYKDQINEKLEEISPLRITSKIVRRLGSLDDVFRSYLTNQSLSIQEELEKRFPKCPKHFVRVIMDGLVTPEGTKRSIGVGWKGTEFNIHSPVPTGWNRVNRALLNEGLLALESARLLRVGQSSIELAHDSLAAIIDGQRSAHERQLNLYRQQIRTSFELFSQTGDYLSKNKIPLYEGNLKALALPIEQQRYYAESVVHWLKEDEFELIKERKKRERWIGFMVLISILSIIILFINIRLNNQIDNANLLERTLKSDFNSLVQQGHKEFQSENLQNSLTYWATARFLNPNSKLAPKLIQCANDAILIDSLINSGHWAEAESLIYKLTNNTIVKTEFLQEKLVAIHESQATWNKALNLSEHPNQDTLEITGKLISLPAQYEGREDVNEIHIHDNPKIVSLSSLLSYSNLESLCLYNNKSLFNISDLNSFEDLSKLKISTYNDLTDQLYGKINNLRYLSLSRTPCLMSLDNFSTLALEELYLSYNNDLFNITSLSELENLKVLGLTGLKVVNFEPIEDIESLRELFLIRNKNLTKIDFISNLNFLEKLVIDGNQSLKISHFPELPTKINSIYIREQHSFSTLDFLDQKIQLKELFIENCISLENISSISSQYELKSLRINNCNWIEDVSNVFNLPELIKLSLSGCHRISNIKIDIQSPSLEELDLRWMKNLKNIDFLADLKNLKHLSLHSNMISDFDPIGLLIKLESLSIYYDDNLMSFMTYPTMEDEMNYYQEEYPDGPMKTISNIYFLEQLPELKKLTIHSQFIKDLGSLSKLKNLEQLDISNNHAKGITKLCKLENLKHLTLSNNSLSDLSFLSCLQKIEYLDLKNNNNIVDISPLYELKNLRYLNISDCPNIPSNQIDTIRMRLPNCTLIQNYRSNSYFPSMKFTSK